MVTGRLAPVSGKMAISWAGDSRINGSRAAITGISLFQPGEPALRLGHLPPRLGLRPVQGASAPGCPRCFGVRATSR